MRIFAVLLCIFLKENTGKNPGKNHFVQTMPGGHRVCQNQKKIARMDVSGFRHLESKKIYFFFAKIFDLTLVVLRKPEFFTLEKCI